MEIFNTRNKINDLSIFDTDNCINFYIYHCEDIRLLERKHSDKIKKLMDKYLQPANWRAVKRMLFEIIFYNSPVDVVYKALGVE
jgi:hypothetical protein